MTLKEARSKLSGSMTFGDPDQIAAVKFLSKVEDAIAIIEGTGSAIEFCASCCGDGEHVCDCGHKHECEDCKGLGYRDISGTSLPEEFVGLPDDAILAAIELQREKRS